MQAVTVPGEAGSLRAEVKRLRDALARHQHQITDSRGACCAGCLEDWPCPDAVLLKCHTCYGSGWTPGIAHAEGPLDELPCPDCEAAGPAGEAGRSA